MQVPQARLQWHLATGGRQSLLKIPMGTGTHLAVIPGCIPTGSPYWSPLQQSGMRGLSPHSERQSREINKDPSLANLSSSGTELHTYLIIITELLG